MPDVAFGSFSHAACQPTELSARTLLRFVVGVDDRFLDQRFKSGLPRRPSPPLRVRRSRHHKSSSKYRSASSSSSVPVASVAIISAAPGSIPGTDARNARWSANGSNSAVARPQGTQGNCKQAIPEGQQVITVVPARPRNRRYGCTVRCALSARKIARQPIADGKCT